MGSVGVRGVRGDGGRRVHARDAPVRAVRATRAPSVLRTAVRGGGGRDGCVGCAATRRRRGSEHARRARRARDGAPRLGETLVRGKTRHVPRGVVHLMSRAARRVQTVHRRAMVPRGVRAVDARDFHPRRRRAADDRGVQQMPRERAKQPCVVCGRAAGVTMRCSYGHCQTAFHPLCARQAGLHVRASDGAKPHHRAYCEKHSQAHAERRREACRRRRFPPPPNMAPVTMPGGAGVGGLPAGSPLAASRAAAIAANPEAARARPEEAEAIRRLRGRRATREELVQRGASPRIDQARPRARAFRAASHANGRGARGRGEGVPGNVARRSRRCDAGCAQAREIRAGEGETSSGRRGRRRGGRRSDERQRRGLGDHRGRWTMAETRAEAEGAARCFVRGRRGDDRGGGGFAHARVPGTVPVAARGGRDKREAAAGVGVRPKVGDGVTRGGRRSR